MNPGSVFAPFFGVPALTMLLINRLARATALNRGIEDAVNTCPEQYLWAYKRFRRRPEGMPKLYQGPL